MMEMTEEEAKAWLVTYKLLASSGVTVWSGVPVSEWLMIGGDRKVEAIGNRMNLYDYICAGLTKRYCEGR
jgi:hypothetical protein